MASNTATVNPLAKATRWSAQEKKKVLVDQPDMINQYNRNMGGVDRLDQNVGTYRISIRSKKWWWPLFAFLPDAAINNAWLLYRLSPAHGNLPLDQLAFKRSVAQVYLQLLKAQQHLPGAVQPQQTKRQKVAAEVRHSDAGHHLRSMPKQRQCSLCGKKANMLCGVCNVPLHQKCTEQFHS
jgi:DNA excision repair protein ERCC-6